MKTWRNLSLVLALTLLAVHEMDAMTHAEWRLLPVLSGMEDGLARDVFVLLHIPLYTGLIWTLFLGPWKQISGRVFCGVLIGHAAAHFALSGHHLYTFAAPIETITVYGGAFASAVFLVLSYIGRSE